MSAVPETPSQVAVTTSKFVPPLGAMPVTVSVICPAPLVTADVGATDNLLGRLTLMLQLRPDRGLPPPVTSTVSCAVAVVPDNEIGRAHV